MTIPNAEQLKAALEKLKYEYLDDGKLYHLNIIGIRSSSPISNSFNDIICLLYNDETGPRFKYMACTTKPGNFYLEHPDNSLGTAILCPGQYINSFATGLHHGEYTCLVAIKTLKVYRDNTKEDSYSSEILNNLKIYDAGVECGIHIHHASPDHQSTEVDNWSAGCTVIADPASFATLMGLVNKSIVIRGNSFTYTLIGENDL